ncbi:MAG: epimerase [Bacteroidota bacterium]|jgi:uncharacterized protein YbjT (DUF2867 family)
MKIKAIIFGATGMVGEGVLDVALRHPDVESVLVIGRKRCDVKHEKLHEILHKDFYDYTGIQEQLKGFNACFFCLGVTSVGKKEDEYTRLTYDLTMSAATILARLNPDMTFCYVSGTGTDSSEKGRVMWARVKGKTENHLMKLPFKAVYAFRPGFIKPIEGQKNAYGVSKVLGVAYPLLKALLPKYVCALEDLGLAMIGVSTVGYSRKVLENPDIAGVAQLARMSK